MKDLHIHQILNYVTRKQKEFGSKGIEGMTTLQMAELIGSYRGILTVIKTELEVWVEFEEENEDAK